MQIPSSFDDGIARWVSGCTAGVRFPAGKDIFLFPRDESSDHSYLVPRLGLVELYFHSLIRLRDIITNYGRAYCYVFFSFTVLYPPFTRKSLR
jgi:hypothetical protein